MATYKEIKGVTVQTRDEDPVIGGVAGGTWSSGGTLNSDRESWAGVSGTRDASITFGGYPGSPSNANTEKYDGTSWTEVNNLNEGRHGNAGSVNGSQTATLCFGGTSPVTTDNESWNGTNWTEVGELNTARFYVMGAGTSTAALGFGGNTPSATNINESWNGSAWTEVADLNNGRGYGGSAGTSTAAIAMGGDDGSPRAYTEIWDGSSWTEVSDLNTTRYGVGGAGTSTDGLCFAGYPTGAINEHWNGSSWTEVADLGTARGYTTGHGATSGAAICLSGTPGPGNYRISEEFATAPTTAAILKEGMIFLSGGTTLKGFGKAAGIPAGTWASGGTLNTARTIGGGFGLTIPTAVCAGGYNPGGWKALVEEYNGSAFTEVNDMPQATDDMGSGGSLTAGIVFGGDKSPSNTTTDIALAYDGTNWTALSNLNTARRSIGGAGIQTSALAFGGQEPGSASAKTESWDGSSWTETSDLNTARMGVQGAGHSNTAAIGAGGGLSPVVNNVEQWDGSSWTEKNNLNTARSFFAGGGVSTAALFYGGYVGTPSYTGKTESWNGTSMTEVNDMATGRGSTGALPAGGAVSQIASGGNPQPTASSETFEAEATLSTVTVS
jgi:hypothetical protein